MGNASSMLTQYDIEEVQEYCHNLFIFKVYDSDFNGRVTLNDILEVLRDLTGPFISERQREHVLSRLLDESGYSKGYTLMLDDFVKVLSKSGLKMDVEVPVD